MQHPKPFRHISLFSGMGGFDVAADWMGWENVAHCEWNPFGQRILKYYWPNAHSYSDITKTDFTKYYGTIDIITGGFPCQPYSTAGKRKGKDDERHLWPHMLRVIKEVAPRWVVGENVDGLINWSGGLVFHEVQTDLESAGYQVQPFVLPAAGVNAPHKRNRVWFIARRVIVDPHDNNGSRSVRRGESVPTSISAEHRPEHGTAGEFSRADNGNAEQCTTTATGGNVGTVLAKDDRIGTNGIIQTELWTNVTTNTDNDGCNTGNGQYEQFTGEAGIDALGNAGQSVGNGNVADADGLGQSNGYPERSDKPGQLSGSDTKKGHDANTKGEGLERYGGHEQISGFGEKGRDYESNSGNGNVANNISVGHTGKEHRQTQSGLDPQNDPRKWWANFPTQPPVCSGNDGIPAGLDGITFSKWRNESIKAAGNAVVPQVVLQIFKTIADMERLHPDI